MAKYRHHALAALSGLLLGLAYPGWSFGLGWLTWIGLIPLFWAITRYISADEAHRKRTVFLISATSGLVYFLIIFRWIWSIHPLDTLGIESASLSLIATITIYLVSSVGMVLFWGLWGLAFSFLTPSVSSRLSVLKKSTRSLAILSWTSIPATFVLFEYLRSWGFGFLWAGSGSLFGPHWTLGNLAYALAGNSVIRWLASYIGIYGITFLIVLANCLLAKTIYGHRMSLGYAFAKLKVAAILVVIVAISVAGYFNFNSGSTGKTINYAIIQTAQPTKLSPSPQETLASFKEQLELLDRVAKEHPESQLIVFPEASDFFKNLSLFLTPKQVQSYFSKLFKEPRLIIAGGKIIDATNGNAYSRVFSLDTQGDIIGYYDKRLPVPGGEFLPYPIRLLVYFFAKNSLPIFNETRDLESGQKEISTVGFRYNFNIAPIICSELVSPSIVGRISQNADVLTSLASYGVFHGNRAIADQMLAATLFRAAESSKPIITAANMGRSYVVDSGGKVQKIAENNLKGILTGSVDIAQHKTWYNKSGDAPLILGCLLLGIMTVLKKFSGQIKNWLRRNQS